MKLRDALRLAGIVAVASVLLAGTVAVYTTARTAEAHRHSEAADALVKGISELRFLTTEYLMNQEERIRMQWRARRASLAVLLDLAAIAGQEPSAVAEIRGNLERVETLFERIAVGLEKRPADEGERQLALGTQSRLVSQLLISSQAMIAAAVLLQEQSADQVRAAQNDASLAFFLLVGLLSALMGTAGIVFTRMVIRPAFALRDAALRVASGDYGARARVHADNEMGELVRAFNDMVRRIQDSHTELARTNKELEAFSYSVSHDLRAPLRGIDGFSQALLEDYADRLDDQGKDYLRRVRAGAQRLGQLIDDMLMLSRISRSELSPQMLDLSALAETVAEELRRSDPGRSVEFRIARDLRAYGDPRLLAIALGNLLGNAWKFTGKQETATIEVGVLNNGDDPAFCVRDDGVGFDMAYADKLFVPFQRLHAASEFPGTGIGLTIVQRIIHRHGGRVWAEGAVGKGATFCFSLPNRI